MALGLCITYRMQWALHAVTHRGGYEILGTRCGKISTYGRNVHVRILQKRMHRACVCPSLTADKQVATNVGTGKVLAQSACHGKTHE
jgi:hypothetical protein